jgi:hypothetical protein
MRRPAAPSARSPGSRYLRTVIVTITERYGPPREKVTGRAGSVKPKSFERDLAHDPGGIVETSRGEQCGCKSDLADARVPLPLVLRLQRGRAALYAVATILAHPNHHA